MRTGPGLHQGPSARLRDGFKPQATTGADGQPCPQLPRRMASDQVMVEPRGLEPLTPCLQNRRSLSDTVAHWGCGRGCVRWDRTVSDPVVVRFGGQGSPGMCGAARTSSASMCRYSAGLFVLKPSTGKGCQRRSALDLGQAVRGCPSSSTAVSGDCYSPCYSVPHNPVS